MTLRTEDRFARLARRGPSAPSVRRTMLGDVVDLLDGMLAEAKTVRWPNLRYASDPIGYCEHVLGFEPWARQREIIEALRDHPRVAALSGQKTGKTRLAAAAALWFYGTVPSGRVFLVAPRAPQIQNIIWPEVSQLHRGSGRCLECRTDAPEGPRPCPHAGPLDGDMSTLATTGLRGTPDGRTIVAVTAKTIEALAGYSGPQLWIIDESSGVEDHVFDVIDGNGLGGGLKALYLGNPTKNKGRMFEIFNSPKRVAGYVRVQMSSVEAAAARDRQGRSFGFLAKQTEIDERRELWGEESALYKVRVLGQYALNEDGAVFSVTAIAEAIERWEDDPGEGRLFIGVDPAGGSGLGDESVFAVRRGTKILAIIACRGLDEDAHLREIMTLIEEHKRDRETPVVVVDREGSIGSVLHARIMQHLSRYRAPVRAPWEYVPVKASLAAERMPQAYPRVRDELIANLEKWFRTGSIPDDDKLSKELNAISWIEQIDQRLKATPKDELKKVLERSPDRMDAVALACWESLSLRMQQQEMPPSAQNAVDRDRRTLSARRANPDELPPGRWETLGEDGWGGDARRRRR